MTITDLLKGIANFDIKEGEIFKSDGDYSENLIVENRKLHYFIDDYTKYELKQGDILDLIEFDVIFYK